MPQRASLLVDWNKFGEWTEEQKKFVNARMADEFRRFEEEQMRKKLRGELDGD